MNVPGGEVCPSASAGVLVLDVDRSPPGRWQRGVLTAPRLDAGLLVGGEDIITRAQGLALPAPMVEIENATGLRGEGWIPREDPAAMPPGTQCILGQPAPEGC